MHWCEMHDEPRMFGEPLADFFAMMGADIVAHEVNRADRRVKLRVQCFQKGDEFPLPLPVITVPIDLARAGVKGRKEVEGACAPVFILMPVAQVLGLRGARWG